MTATEVLGSIDFNESMDTAAVHLLKGNQCDILQFPGIMYLDRHTNFGLQVGNLYNHVRIEIHLFLGLQFCSSCHKVRS